MGAMGARSVGCMDGGHMGDGRMGDAWSHGEGMVGGAVGCMGDGHVGRRMDARLAHAACFQELGAGNDRRDNGVVL